MEENQITVISFIIAMSQLKDPLSAPQQEKLKLIGQQIAQDVQNIALIDLFGEEYPAFDKVYQNIRFLLEKPTVERNKAGFPIIDEAQEAQSKEISNIADALSNNNDRAVQIMTKIIHSNAPVKTAQEELQTYLSPQY
ncbi:MAG: hypothetical protein RLZZ338_2946 [Cyanobacteriota bacterium]|jgi:hypothetical protein